jgi:hypothetical protein
MDSLRLGSTYAPARHGSAALLYLTDEVRLPSGRVGVARSEANANTKSATAKMSGPKRIAAQTGSTFLIR